MVLKVNEVVKTVNRVTRAVMELNQELKLFTVVRIEISIYSEMMHRK
jgi:hypothetical protein